MGLTDMPKVDADSSIASTLMDMYLVMGDALAQQYGGSAAHNTVFPERQGKSRASTNSSEFIKYIKRYYSNAYTDGDKQDAINLFLGYFQPQEGKPALWELDSDYYLHVSGGGDNVVPETSPLVDGKPGAPSNTLSPVPACREDFLRIKLTSLDKLLDRTCGSIRNVRLYSEADRKSGTSGVAPDAAEIQLKSPNWLFGQRKYDVSSSAPKTVPNDSANVESQHKKEVDAICDLSWLFPMGEASEGDLYQRYHAMTSVNEANGWYGGTLLGDQDENSEIYRHYAELIQGPAMEPFEHDIEKEKYYAKVLSMGTIETRDDAAVAAQMEAALEEYQQFGSDLGIIPQSCNALAVDPSLVTRWIVGEERIRQS